MSISPVVSMSFSHLPHQTNLVVQSDASMLTMMPGLAGQPVVIWFCYCIVEISIVEFFAVRFFGIPRTTVLLFCLTLLCEEFFLEFVKANTYTLKLDRVHCLVHRIWQE